MENEVSEVEFDICRLKDGRYRATFHRFRPLTRWDPPNSHICESELEAMMWIDGRLSARGLPDVLGVRDGD